MFPSSDIELLGAVRLSPAVTVERIGEEFLALVGQQVVRVAGPSAVVLAAVQQQAGLPGVGLPSGVVVGAGEVARAVDVLVDLGVFERTAAPDAAPDAVGGAQPVSVSRRRALRAVGTAAALGVTVLVLPHAAAASSGTAGPGTENGGTESAGTENGGTESAGLVAPTVTAEPIGYVGSDTGAIRIEWSPVTGATGYEVGWATAPGAAYTFIATAGDTTSYDLTGLVGTDTTHHVVVRATAGGTSGGTSSEVTSSSVIATGGTVTLSPEAGTPTHVVHSFATGGTFKLNRSIDVEHLVVGGGGGGGGCTGRDFCAGGGGGGGVVTGSVTRTAGDYVVVVGAGGRGGPDVAITGNPPVSPGADGYARGGDSSSFGEVVALGGGAGGSAPFSGTADGGDPAALPSPNTESTAAKATGGGGAGQTSSQVGAGVSPRKGGNGTSSAIVASQRAGGGGGAGGDGNAGSGTTSGSGGVGVASSISGTSVEYGSGGGGGKRDTGDSGPGGLSDPSDLGLVTAGGRGGLDAAGSAGVEGRGGGGGGSGRRGGSTPGLNPAAGVAVGGAGGSGVVIVRVALPS